MHSFFLLAAVVVSGAVAAVLFIVGVISLGMASSCERGNMEACGGLGETVGLVLTLGAAAPMFVAFGLWEAYKKSP